MASSDHVRAGYWVFRREGDRNLADIPLNLFTHIYAAFAQVEPNGNIVVPRPNLESLIQDFRRRYPSVKILLSIGGTDEDQAAILSAVVADEDRRNTFIAASITLADDIPSLDGLDLCWLYPSNADQEQQLSAFFSDWRTALPQTLLLTAAVFHHPVHNTFTYPIQAISVNLDWINVLATDFYTPSTSPNETGPVHAWRTRPEEPDRCGNAGIHDWIERGVAKSKLVFGLPFYGYEWLLLTTEEGFFEPASGGSVNLAYRDIQERLLTGFYETVYSRDYEAVYSRDIDMQSSNIGYDDALSISGKVIKTLFDEYQLRGYFAWKHLGDDDTYWTLSRSAYESSRTRTAA